MRETLYQSQPQPIATAPQERRVLIFDPDRGFWTVGIQTRMSENFWVWWADGTTMRPTLWAELPAVPR